MTASVVYLNGNYTLSITDTTSGKSATKSFGGSFQRSSAEWIV